MDNLFHKLEDLSKVELVNLLNSIFSDYVLRMHWTLESFERDVRENNISLSESFVMEVKGEYAGVVLLSFRGKRAKIDLMGVLSSFRREGIGFRMVDEALKIAKWNGCEQIVLEVPEKDSAAIAFYEKYGFRHKRNLITFFIKRPGTKGFSLKKSDSSRIIECALSAISNFKRNPEWEREPSSFTHLEQYNFDFVENSEGKERGYCIWQEKDSLFYVRDAGPVKSSSYREIIGGLCGIAKDKGLTPLFPTVPDDDPLFMEATELDPQVLLKQSEMIYKIH